MNTRAILTALCLIIAAFAATGTTAHASLPTVDECIACHLDRSLVKKAPDGTLKSLYVDREAFLESVHGRQGYTCVDCHHDARPETHPAEGLARVDCAACHTEEADAFAASAHGQLLRQGVENAPQCYDCHTSHTVMHSDNPLSSVHPDNLQMTCGVCHKDEAAPVICQAVLDLAAGDTTALQRISAASALSIIATRLKGHGKADFGCTYSTQRCSDCHFEVGNHSAPDKQPQICAACHDMNRNSVLFGKIHKPSIFTGPMILLLLIMYALCVGGLVLFFRKTAASGKKEQDPPAE